jgi:hypothetical protein
MSTGRSRRGLTLTIDVSQSRFSRLVVNTASLLPTCGGVAPAPRPTAEETPKEARVVKKSPAGSGPCALCRWIVEIIAFMRKSVFGLFLALPR